MAEEYITLTEAARRTPGRPHVSAIWRWCRCGVKIRGTQQRIRLRHVRCGARLLTKPAWIEEFMTALADADAAHFAPRPDPTPTPRGRTPEQRQRAIEAARRRLGVEPAEVV